MANMYDYLAWRGDLPLSQVDFNEVDNLVLAWLSYADLAGAVPGLGEGEVTLAAAAERFFATHPRVEKVDPITALNPLITSIQLLEKLAQSPRFRDVKLTGYVSELDLTQEKQFSAVTVLLDKERAYVAYRGTDHSIIGWKEDFAMSFMPEVPAQHDARWYLQRTAELYPRELYLGGHSKGGNLAVFAGAHAEAPVQSRVLQVYSNDGPGVSGHTLGSEGYDRVRSKINSIVPQSSVVGMLLGHEDEHKVVRSAQFGLLQHNALDWQVQGPGFECAPHLATSSLRLDRTVRDWLAQLDTQQLRTFVDTLFDGLLSTGATTLEELSAHGLRATFSVFNTLRKLDSDTRSVLRQVFEALLRARKLSSQETEASDVDTALPEAEAEAEA